MKVSINWLRDIIECPVDDNTLIEGIPANGLEIETVKKTSIGKQDVVSCEIKSIEKHPNADTLFVTKIDVGVHGEKQIVTNIKTLTVGKKLLVALEGVKITEDFVIRKTQLKKIDSEGMFVGWEELGFNLKSPDPIFLDNDTANGLNYLDIAAFDDTIIDIELTANRGDCLGMKGMATDIKARFNGLMKDIDISYKTTDKKVKDEISVEIKTDDCHRYAGAVIHNVVIKPSPLWMQLRLVIAGIRPINNVVDITNYVLYEMNQPLHAFDYDKIADKKIIVRNANQNEKMTTLDSIERSLDPQDIVIADTKVGHCLGGVMGGEISEVNPSTTSIFLEAAFFDPIHIRKCSKRLGLRSESSYRFEREIDKLNVTTGLKRALHFFNILKVGDISEGIIDNFHIPYNEKKICVTTNWINNKLGTSLKNIEISSLLKQLDFEVDIKGDDLNIVIPSWRNDVAIKEDIAEEVARIYGYNNIKPTIFPSTRSGVRTFEQKMSIKLHDLMIESGCSEAYNFSFVGKSLFDKMDLPDDHYLRNVVTLEVPLTEDWSSMRSSLIPGLIRTASFNMGRQNRSFTLYEIGNISIPTNDILPIEKKKVGCVLCGYRSQKDYTGEAALYDFYDVKGIIDNISESFGVEFEFVETDECFLQPYQQAQIKIKGKNAGVFGKVHPLVSKKFDIEAPLYVMELDVELLFENCREHNIHSDIPKFPSSERDLALVVPENIKSADLIKAIKSANVDFLREISVFDIYKGGSIEAGYYSIAVKLLFNKIDATLTDVETETATQKIISQLEKNINAKLR